VVVAGAVSVPVVVAVEVLVDSVVVVAVLLVADADPVSSTTAGASVWVVVSVVVVSFFWQPVESATAAMAARPRVRNFFINLISFLLKRCLGARKSKPERRKIDAESYPNRTPCQPKRGTARLGVIVAIPLRIGRLRALSTAKRGLPTPCSKVSAID